MDPGQGAVERRWRGRAARERLLQARTLGSRPPPSSAVDGDRVAGPQAGAQPLGIVVGNLVGHRESPTSAARRGRRRASSSAARARPGRAARRRRAAIVTAAGIRRRRRSSGTRRRRRWRLTAPARTAARSAGAWAGVVAAAEPCGTESRFSAMAMVRGPDPQPMPGSSGRPPVAVTGAGGFIGGASAAGCGGGGRGHRRRRRPEAARSGSAAPAPSPRSPTSPTRRDRGRAGGRRSWSSTRPRSSATPERWRSTSGSTSAARRPCSTPRRAAGVERAVHVSSVVVYGYDDSSRAGRERPPAQLRRPLHRHQERLRPARAAARRRRRPPRRRLRAGLGALGPAAPGAGQGGAAGGARGRATA